MQRYVLIWGARSSRPSLSGTQSHHTDLVTEGLAPSSHSCWGFPLGALAFPAPPGSFSPFSRLAVDSAFLHRTDRCLCQEPRLFPLGSPGACAGAAPPAPNAGTRRGRRPCWGGRPQGQDVRLLSCGRCPSHGAQPALPALPLASVWKHKVRHGRSVHCPSPSGQAWWLGQAP